jgi:trigger factor
MGAKDLADLKTQISARISEDYGNASRIKLKRDLLDIFDKEYKFEIPQKLIDAEYEIIEKQYKDAKAKNQLDEEEKNRSEKDILAEYKEIALRRVKLGLLLSEIGNSEKITLTADDVNKAIMNEAKRYPGQEKMVMDYYLKNKQAVEAIKAPAYEEKIVDFVLSKAKLSDKKVSVEELYDFSEKAPAKAKKTTKKSA